MSDIVIKQRVTPSQKITLPTVSHPLLERLYITRGITSVEQLNHSTQALLNYQQLLGIDQAAELLYQAVLQQKNILIVGDFDTDGATSTALVVTALKRFGVKNVNYMIPDRFEDGYGLSVSVVKKALEKQAELIITVDNGVSAFEAVEFAQQHNIQVIITDHHLAPDVLPKADAIINPNLHGCSFASKNLAGVGVAFYFMLAFRALLREHNWFQTQNLKEYNLANLLDLVALGTIADMVALDQNNRILVQQGLGRIRAGYCCAGIKALITITKKNMSQLTSQDLSFYLAPRINAAGRMENMSLGVELLLADDEQSAYELAEVLEDLNSSRKVVEQNMQQEAWAFIEQLEQTTQDVPTSFVLYHPDFHQGVIGVLSSRVKERFYRPVISFAVAENGDLKGSGRSIHGVHLRDILEKVNLRAPNLIICFGGHAMAAGLTIAPENLAMFTQYFSQEVAKAVEGMSLENIIETDGEIDSAYFNYETARLLKETGPWGEQFPEPVFDGVFSVYQQKLIANKHLKLVVQPANGEQLINCIAFNVDLALWPDQSVKTVKMAYNLDVDEFRGNQGVNLLVRYLQALN
ncbi:exonuclease RecJ [Orbus hercynius]|uniref:Single-stranded-DNA-specific exonuclease RecJ n=1 Tax=Orbus hercynius TaxID=593135 RepID=A0A495REH4_9GAMM|nr:single-stranded-DNA-specific exonuclease RecJ [Orbus hercynius]RKS85765.1 exonuclease RecJ [Orbus hercynius]